jgi:hypothetical protein
MDKKIIWIGAGILALLLISTQKTSATASKIIMDDGQSFDFSELVNSYGPDKVNRLSRLFMAMQNKGLSRLQIQLMLAQALWETGLFTDAPNYNNMDNLNNFAGIGGNSRYSALPGQRYANYPSLNDFVNDWIYILNFGTSPIDASSVNEFVNRLKQNGYFEDNTTNYVFGVNTYYNLLDKITV